MHLIDYSANRMLASVSLWKPTVNLASINWWGLRYVQRHLPLLEDISTILKDFSAQMDKEKKCTFDINC